jgi:hypothetical protein
MQIIYSNDMLLPQIEWYALIVKIHEYWSKVTQVSDVAHEPIVPLCIVII